MFHQVTIPLRVSLSSSFVARDQTRLFLSGFERVAHSNAAQLIVSELVANAVIHGGKPIRLELTSDDLTMRIEVFDGDPHAEHVVPRTPVPDGESGRGLRLVATSAQSWGVRSLRHGKSVWADIDLD